MVEKEVKNPVKKTKAQLHQEKLLALFEAADRDNGLKDPGQWSTTTGESFKDLFEESLKRADFKVGDVVKGRVVSVEEDYVLVDINYKSEGAVAKSEFRLVEGREEVKVGQELDVYIERIEDDDGMMVLSKDRADILRTWKDISRVVENEEVIEGTVVAKVKGGLSVDIGVKAFLPGSQIELRPVHNLNTYIGKKYQFKVIKFNQKRGNIVLSRRVILQEERKTLRSRILAEMKEGSVVRGTVKNITDYGAFLDLGGLDGLLHITDMRWSRVRHPSEVLSLGQELDVKVLKFDAEKNRVSLGLKQLQDDPWVRISQELKIGDVLKATVVSLTDYGAFVKIRDGVEGLVHVSEMSWGKKVRQPSQILKVGDEVDVKMLGIDQETRRISLGMRQLMPNPWMGLKEKYSPGDELSVSVKSITDFGVFVELEGEELDGFIHVSDLSWTEHINPKSTYKKGQPLKAFVKSIQVEEGRFNLSLKSLTGDPWMDVESRYPPGSRHEVKVIKLMNFGVFVELEPGIEGLIHISELSTDRVESVEQFVKVGETMKAEVLNIDLDARKIGLSIKQIQLREDLDLDSKTPPARAAAAPSEKQKGEPSSPAEEGEGDPSAPESAFGKALKVSLGGVGQGVGQDLKKPSVKDDSPKPADEEVQTAKTPAPATDSGKE